MRNHTIALFGEAERGVFQRAYACNTLEELAYYLGQPPPHSCGLTMAIQAILSNHPLVFFRVEEEGFSLIDYYKGLDNLERSGLIVNLEALGLPGVGDTKLLKIGQKVCQAHNSILLMTEQDLYDYLTDLPH